MERTRKSLWEEKVAFERETEFGTRKRKTTEA